jgi:signal transduction histidine kinase
MKGYVEVLERRLKRSGSVGLVEYTDKLDDQLSKMAGLVRDLLDISKIQSGQLAIRRERISINTVVAQSVEEVQGLLHHHHVVVHGWCNTPVLGDPVRLEQVLVNLLSNAIKYSPTADRVVIRVVESKAQVVISVQDFGMGIAKNEQATIFEPYFRSQHMERTDVPGGLGMGLYIAKEIIVWHGGRIWLDSELNKGTTFSLSLPLYKDGV